MPSALGVINAPVTSIPRHAMEASSASTRSPVDATPEALRREVDVVDAIGMLRPSLALRALGGWRAPAQSNLNTPLRTPYRYATTLVKMKNMIRASHTPRSLESMPRFANVVAHGYRKMISMSNTRNTIAIR